MRRLEEWGFCFVRWQRFARDASSVSRQAKAKPDSSGKREPTRSSFPRRPILQRKPDGLHKAKEYVSFTTGLAKTHSTRVSTALLPADTWSSTASPADTCPPST